MPWTVEKLQAKLEKRAKFKLKQAVTAEMNRLWNTWGHSQMEMTILGQQFSFKEVLEMVEKAIMEEHTNRYIQLETEMLMAKAEQLEENEEDGA